MISLAATCLALAVYFESGGEPDLGKQYVAHVVMNRSTDYEESSVCAAVFDPYQFSWTNTIKRSSSLKVMTKTAVKRIEDEKTWIKCVEIAKKVMARRRDITNGAKFFNERKMGVRYKTPSKSKVIGKHIFY
jgi:spore germination cell wall hydrolase CwlJ-like protein